MTLRIVVVGTGFGKNTVAPIYQSLGCDVTVVSPHDSAVLSAAIEAPCDLVSVHSPPFLHLEHVRLAATRHRNVLCDKPFGRNAGEANEMLNLVATAGVLHFLNFEFRVHPANVKAKELLDRGEIGAPIHTAYRVFLSYARQAPHRWLHEKDKGGGFIGGFGSHAVDLFRWLFGEIAAAGAQRRTDMKTRRDRDPSSERLHTSTAEDAFTAWFRMENGVTATLDACNSIGASLPQQLTILGSDGVIQITEMSEVAVLRPGKEPELYSFPKEADPHQPAIGIWLAQICDAVARGRQITPDFNTGVACVKVLDLLRGST